MAATGIVHQDAAHDLGAGGHEMRTVQPVRALAVDQVQEGFVYQRCGLERVALRLCRHVVLGDAMQFPVQQRNQFLERVPIPGAPGVEQAGDVLPRLLFLHVLETSVPAKKLKNSQAVAVSAAAFR